MADVGVTNADGGERACLCPRCGYDLSGAVASWTESCPIEGVCSECGLGFAWCHVLNPTLRVPLWSYEHAAEPSIRLFFASLSRSLLPHRFWKQFPLESPLNPRRLWRFVGVTLTWSLVWGAGSLTIALIAVSFIENFQPGGFGAFEVVASFFRASSLEALASPMTILSLEWTLLFPLTLLLLRNTTASRKIRGGHILRAAVFSLPPVLAVAVGIAVRALLVSAKLSPGIGFGSVDAYDAIAPAWTAGWLFWYWCNALARYFKILDFVEVVFLNGLITGLASLAIPYAIARVLGNV